MLLLYWCDLCNKGLNICILNCFGSTLEIIEIARICLNRFLDELLISRYRVKRGRFTKSSQQYRLSVDAGAKERVWFLAQVFALLVLRLTV